MKGNKEAMETKIHFRRCHVCGTLNEAPGKLVADCSSCGKHLAPFHYFDESIFMGLPLRKEEKRLETSPLPYKSYPPLWGLTAYW
jgi:hypothetical protein